MKNIKTGKKARITTQKRKESDTVMSVIAHSKREVPLLQKYYDFFRL